jgi:hypothetical protein
MRGHHHQHRQPPGFAGTDRYPHFREPEIALRMVTGCVADPVRGISWCILRPDPGHVLPKPCRRPGPAHPLREHRRGHPRVLQQQRTNGRFYGFDLGGLRGTDVCRRPVGADCLRDRVPGDPQPRRVIDSPSARCNRRISTQSSTVITHPIVWNGWLSFQPSQWLIFRPSPTRRNHDRDSCGH